MKKRTANYTYMCVNPDCNQIVGYNNSGDIKKKKPTMCFECLIKKSKRELELSLIRNNKLFAWND